MFPEMLPGKIYKVVCEASKEIYVGSTVKSLLDRLKEHTDDAVFMNKKNKFMAHIRCHGVQFFRIELLEAWPCEDKGQLRKREQHWMDRLNPGLNSHRAYGRNPRKRTAADFKYYKAWKKRQC